MKGETVNLPKKYYRKLRISIIIAIIGCLKILFPIISVGFITLLSVFMYTAYTDSDINYYLPVYLCWWLYYCFCAVQITAIAIGYSVLFGIITLYLFFKLDEVNEMFKRIRSGKRFIYNSIIKAIDNHYSVAYKIIKFDSILTKAFAILYLGVTIAIDISLFIAIYGSNPLVRIICGNLAFLLFFRVLLFGLFLSSISSKAHWSYQLMNSLIATKKIPLRLKFKVIFKTYIRYKTYIR